MSQVRVLPGVPIFMGKITMLVVFIIFQLLDGITTSIAVHRFGNIAEANPVLFWAFNQFGHITPLILTKLLCIAGGILLYRHDRFTTIQILNAVMSVIVFSTIGQLIFIAP